MFFAPTNDIVNGRQGRFHGLIALALAMITLPGAVQARPARLIIALDGIAYRDMVALQTGIMRTNFWGKKYELHAFTADEGYFPVSRMISTFPSASDVAWTDIFGDRPLPGYQRTYFSTAANSMLAINGVTTTMEHERQMDWQLQNGFLRAMGYMFPAHTLFREIHGTVTHFWNCKSSQANYYVYLRASDDAKHLDRDIFSLLCVFDQKLQKLRAKYKAAEGHDLEIVILSDHGHNHAGRGIRVRDDEYLEQAGYHVTETISGPKDVILPVVGIESWIELHCLPSETKRLAELLTRLEGVDVLAAPVFGTTNRFFILNTNGVRADIEWNAAQNSFRYSPVTGDPLNYRPVIDALKANHKLDGDGHAAADDWMSATMTNHYPLALERIMRGLTRSSLNPATILISLDNRFVNDYWLTDKGSRLVTCRSTHGGLDDICSDGIVLTNFKPTRDTSTDRVAGQFNNFVDVKDFRTTENGAEFVTKAEQSLVRIAHVPFDREYVHLPGDGLYLRAWSPALAQVEASAPLDLLIKKVPQFSTSAGLQHIILNQPLTFLKDPPNERVYEFPPDLKLEPSAQYDMTGSIRAGKKTVPLFELPFRTMANGEPAAF